MNSQITTHSDQHLSLSVFKILNILLVKCHFVKKKKKGEKRNSLAVQWLGLCMSTAGGMV